MGEKKTRLKRLQEMYDTCCYCDGPVETAEHCPPKVMFPGSNRPNQWVFPCCKRCNASTKHLDLLLAFYVGSQVLNMTEAQEKQLVKVSQALMNNVPEFKGEMFNNTLRQRLEQGPGKQLKMQLPTKLEDDLEIEYDKLLMSAYFAANEGQPLPKNAQVMHWVLTNAMIMDKGYPKLPFQLPEWQTLSQGKWTTNGQFHFRYAIADGRHAFFTEFQFHNWSAMFSCAFLSEEAINGCQEADTPVRSILMGKHGQ